MHNTFDISNLEEKHMIIQFTLEEKERGGERERKRGGVEKGRKRGGREKEREMYIISYIEKISF